jgi:hypothetical protein
MKVSAKRQWRVGVCRYERKISPEEDYNGVVSPVENCLASSFVLSGRPEPTLVEPCLLSLWVVKAKKKLEQKKNIPPEIRKLISAARPNLSHVDKFMLLYLTCKSITWWTTKWKAGVWFPAGPITLTLFFSVQVQKPVQQPWRVLSNGYRCKASG